MKVAHLISLNSLVAVLTTQDVHEALLEVARKLVQVPAGRLGEEQQLALMRFAHQVTFEAVLIATLLLTHLTVPATGRRLEKVSIEALFNAPSQLLHSLRLHLVRQRLRRALLRLWHRDGRCV